MIGKNNQYLKKTKEGTKVETYSIKKFKVGTASVVIGASIFFGAGAVAQAGEEVSKNTTADNSKNEDATLGGAVSEKVVAKPVVKEATKEEVAAGVAAKLGVKETEKEAEKEPAKALDKIQLSSFISEIEGKISSGAYANKTEESVANLIVDLNSAKATLESATTQDELTKAYQKLVVSVNSKLRNKPVEKKETPAVKSITSNETVGKKVEDTEKKVETNSIENTGSKDPRTGKEIAKNTAFRAAINQDPKVDFTFSIPSKKEIYIYNEENFRLEIPVYSETGKIRYATIKQGSRNKFANVPDTTDQLDIQFGFTATVINRDEIAGVTSDASKENPAKIVITGRPNDVLKNMPQYTKQENQTLNVGTRYIQVVDDQGRENLKKGTDITDPGYFYLVLKSQAKKYALRSQPTDEKISVSSLTNPTAEDLKKIKDSIQLEYSQNNEDARLADKRGTLVEHPEDVIQSVSIVGNNIVVTFTDGSTKTKPVGEIVRKNTPPTVNLPYSNEANRNIYIYSGEETDLTFTATDESKIKDLKLRGPGDINYNNATSFGLAVGNIVDSTVTSGEGSVSENKKTATIKMTGTTSLRDGQKWTSIIVAKDDNNGESAPFNGRINATTNPAERQKIEGYVEFVVKNQTKKYDIKAPEGKVSVVDPANVTAEEFEKIKEKVKIEYSQTNDDANLTSKRGQAVENQATRISTITKDASGNLVVTYKDGSTDTKPLSEYVSLNKQPAIDAINTAADNKIAEINSNANATAEEKVAAIEKVNADKMKALTAINDNSVTTKSALDNAKTSGTIAIGNDNPVAMKKDTAKVAIDTALREKEAAIDANNDLTTEEKNAAKADAQAKSTAAKTAIDNATTNAAVDSAKTAGTTSVSSVTPTATAKPAAKKAIDEALKAKEAQLDARADLTAEEKKAAKADAQARATAAKAAIDNATTNATVDSAKTSGVVDVESVNPQASQKKNDAKNAVDEALKAKEAAIDARADLTDEEKTAAKADAKAKADAAKQAIDKATTNDAVTQAKNNGATSVDSVNPTAQAKPAAKKAIDDALKAKNDAIDARTDLTDEEKTAAKADAKAKADAAKTAIDNVTTNDAVTQAKNDGATSVDSVNPTAQAKPAAKQAIEDALKAKNDTIDANNDLTAEEKAKAKEDARAKADAAKTAIDNATTNEAVEQAKADGATSVNNVNPTAQAKPAAKQAIEYALKAKNDAIDARTDLTDEEKTAAKADAKAKADAAKQAIDNVTTNDAVTQAKNDGATSVDSVNPTAQAKPAAKKAIEDALKAKNDAIDARTDLTDEEKTAAKADAKAKADAAKQAIDNVTTNDAVTQAKNDGATSVDSVNPTAQAKPAAKKAIEDALKAKNDAIDARTDLTDEEKTAAKADAKAKADAAKTAIDNATTNAGVDQAKVNGTTEVNNVNPTPVAKPAAKKAVDDALAEKIKAINAKNDLTDEEKAKAKQEAQNKADAAKTAIDNATTNDAVTQAKNDGATSVDSVNPTAQAKPAAKKAIDAALKAKNAAIDANNDLTDEEKTAAKADAKAKAGAAKQAIDNATTNDAVTQAKANGITEVNNVNPTAEAKPAAKKAIDDALKAKNDAIDANNNLTDEEKTAAKADAKAKADVAKTAIDNATTNAAVEQAKANGTTEVNNVNPKPVAKPAAKKAVEDALAEKIKAINANNDLTDEEKAKAKQEAQNKADAAKQAIDNATTNAGVEQAKANGTTEVNNVNPTPVAKPAAKKAIDDALKAKNAAIDANNDLTDEEKTAAKADVKAKADAAKTAIDNATTNDAVTQAKNDGATSVDSVNPTAQAKPAAKKAIEDALKAKNDAIDANNDLTAEEKAKAKEDAKAKADAAKTAIDNVTTNDAVTQAKTDGATSVDSVNPTAQAKPAAKKAIEDALKAKNDVIDANNDLTDEEKTAAKADAKAKADAAKQAIDNETTNAGVDQAKTDGATSVGSVNLTAQAKPAAKKAIEDALKAKNDAIDANNDLTAEEKAKAKEDAKAKADAAKQAIDNATTNDVVTQAKANGTTEVNNVNPTPVAKPAAKKAVDEALKAKEAEIDANNDLTAEEKLAAKEEAKAKADAAKKAIDEADTDIKVDVNSISGLSDVNSFSPEPVKKSEAKKAIDAALEKKIEEIDARDDLTTEEKTVTKAEAENKANQAKEAIDAADTDIKVDVNSVSGLSDVNSFSPEAAKKPAAKQAIDDALKAKEDAIDANDDLTAEEKVKVKAEAKAKADAAKEAIDNATTNAEVEQAKTAGTTKVDSVNPLAVKKPEAKKAIDEALKIKNDEIDARTDLTDEEKSSAKVEAKKKADAAKEAIDNATTNAEVEQAKTAGTTKIDSVNPTAIAKPEAKKAIDEVLKAKNDEIDARTDLTDEEKTAAKSDAKAKADAAKQAIDNATTNAAVEQAKANGTTEVNNVNPTAQAKPAVKKAIDDALKAKNDAIDARTDLTDEEKTAAKADAKAKADATKTAIDKATTNETVEQAKANGRTEVNNVNPTAVVKPAAKQVIDDALKAKNDEIDARTDLTDEEKTVAKDDAKAKADAAKQAIDNTTTNAGVAQAKTDGRTSVDSVNPLAVKKPEAKKAIDDALKSKNDEIDARTDLTDEEKTAAKADAKVKADAAKQVIDNATTNAGVEQAKANGTTEVDSVNPTAQAKPAAKKTIDDALKSKNDEIDARTDLTDEEKIAAKADAKAKADAAKQAIDNATTNAAVEQAKANGTTEVNNVNPTAEAKPAAKKAIDDALKAKNDVIDARTDLTDEEKTAAKADAKAKADAAKQAIDNATTNAAVEQAKANVTTEVNNVNPTPEAKPAAKKAIDDALKAKNDAIDARTDLTDEEKTKAKEDAKAKADAAKQAIDNATTNAAVEQDKANGTTEVSNVNPTAEAKPEAKKAIDEALKAKNDEIDTRTDLTDEEKTAAKANAKAIADAAKETIDKVVTNAEVEQAKTYGTSEVTSVNPEAVAKTEAKKAVDEALKAKNDEIDARTDLTDEEKIAAKEEVKEKADAVKQAIDNATTNAEVEQAKTNGTTEVTLVDPQPVAKTEAKKAIDDALKAKNDEIDARTDLTDEEKTAARAYAKAKANAAKEAIDKATTNAEVEQAKTNGTLDVTSVDPQPVAKPEAKKAIDEVLKAKNDEIDARRDLTDEEKVKAKEEAKEKADAAKKAIDRATTDEEVEQTEINGTTEVKVVNPQPVAKTAVKQAIDEVLKAKNDEIDARTDLTDEEKISAKADAKAKADAAKEGIDIATTNAEIDQIKKNGTTEVTSVNPESVAKTEAKEAIDETLESKNGEIDARTDLTDEEKTAEKEEAKAKADAAKEAIDKATTNAEVDQAKANGTKEVASVDPEALVKSVAKKAIEDKLAEQLKVIANTPDATDEEKKAAADLAKQLAEVAKKAIDAARENADVKKLQDNSKVGIEEAVPFVEGKPNARKAIDAEAKVKKVAIDARTDISDKVKELLKAEVDEIAAQAKKAIDAASSVDEINKIEEAKKSEIKAVEEVRVPAEKVIVADPTNLTNEEKAKVLAAIKSVNPDVKEITQDAKGNVIVITANGHKQVILVAQVTKTEADLAKENAGNVVNTPVAKTAVADVTKLTEAEEQEIVAKVKAVNPGATVAIDEKGNIIVTNGEGLVFVLPVLDLVIPTDKLTDITANSKVNTPAIRTLVANKGSLTPEEIAKIKAAIEEINPGAIVVVDAKGNATVTTKDGKSMTISSDVLVKDAADVAVKNNGENINLDFDKEVVADINNLTESDKEKVKFKVLGAIREAVELVVDAKGNVTVILKDGRTFTILAKDIFEQRKEVTVNLPEKIKVKDASNLTKTEKEAVKQALITANPNLKDAKITISSTGETTVVYPDGQVIVISAKNLVVTEKTTGVIVEDNAGNYTKEDKKPVVDYSNDKTPKFNAKKGQRLANTGEAETNTGLAGLGMAFLGGLLAVAKRRKEKEE